MTRLRPSRLAAILLFFLGVNHPSLAQRAPEDGLTGPVMVAYDAVVFPGSSPDTFFVDLHYRLKQEFFVYLREPSGAVAAHGDLLVEFIDDNGNATRRESRPIALQRKSVPPQDETLPDIQDVVRFMLPRGRYTIVFEVKAAESKRGFLDRARRIDIAVPTDGFSILPFPSAGYSDSLDVFFPFNRGGGVLFGSSGGMLVHARIPDSAGSVTIDWKLDSESPERARQAMHFTGLVEASRRSSAQLKVERQGFSYALASDPGGPWTGLFVKLPFEKLEPGMYSASFVLRAGSASVERTFKFPVLWPTQPVSLRQFDIAVDALRHVATEDEIDSMIGFMADGGGQRFREFWKLRDPDTTTALNEVQEEYYRRVDEAIRRFSMRGELDGYKTDRGRILILFGIPTSMERVFRPTTGPREVWTYVKLKKRFIFSDPARTGEYSLTQSEDL